MQTIVDMSAVATIRDGVRPTVRCDGVDRCKAASGSDGEGVQQRFADVLPVASAALEEPSERRAVAQEMADVESAGDEVAEETTVKPKPWAKRQGETNPADPEVPGWSLAGIVRPIVQSQPGSGGGVVVAAIEGATAVSVESGQTPTVQTATMPSTQQMPTCEVIAVGVDTETQVPLGKELVDASSVGDDAASEMAPGGQETTQPATAGGSVPLPAGETPVSMPAGGEQGTAVPQPTQEIVTAESSNVPQTAPRTVQVEHPDVPTNGKAGGTESMPAPQGADVAVRVDGQETPAVPKSLPGQPALTVVKTGFVPERPPSVVPETYVGVETAAKSEKNTQDHAPSWDGQQSNTSMRPTIPSSVNTKAEPIQAVGNDSSAAAVKDTAAASLHQSTFSAVESIVSSPRAPAPADAQPEVSTNAPVARTPVQSVGDQILDSVQASAARGDRQVLIRLNPPELGTVLVRFHEQGEHLTGTLEVSRSESRREVEQALPQVVRTLQEAGVQIRRLEVVTSDQPERDLTREHLAQDAWSQHQGTGQGREQSTTFSQARWSQGRAGQSAMRAADREAQSQSASAQGRIDLLL